MTTEVFVPKRGIGDFFRGAVVGSDVVFAEKWFLNAFQPWAQRVVDGKIELPCAIIPFAFEKVESFPEILGVGPTEVRRLLVVDSVNGPYILQESSLTEFERSCLKGGRVVEMVFPRERKYTGLVRGLPDGSERRSRTVEVAQVIIGEDGSLGVREVLRAWRYLPWVNQVDRVKGSEREGTLVRFANALEFINRGEILSAWNIEIFFS